MFSLEIQKFFHDLATITILIVDNRLMPQSSEDGHSKDTRVVVQGMYMKAADLIAKTKVPTSKSIFICELIQKY